MSFHLIPQHLRHGFPEDPVHSLPIAMAQALDGLLLDCHSGNVDLIQASGARTAYCIPQKLQPCSLPRIHVHPWTYLILAQLD